MSLDPFTAGFDLVKTALDKIFPDADLETKGKLEAAAKAIDTEYQLKLEQIKTNQIEAASSSWMASNWRPLLGMVCTFAFAYSSVLEPFLRFIATVIFKYDGSFPAINTNITEQLLYALLGLGTMRTFEKSKGLVK